MTVTSEANRWQSSGNGVTTAFSVGKVFDDDELVVYLLDADDVPELQVKTTDYTVSGILTNTVVVTFLVAPPSGYTVVIYRDFALTQTTDIKNQGPYDPEIHEDRFDILTLQIQTLRAELDRALRLPMTDITGADVELPTPVANMNLGWDENGNIANVSMNTDVVAAATTSTPGVVELSLDAEAQAKSGGTVITAGNLAALDSSETFRGFAERATTAEAQSLTDDVRYLTALKSYQAMPASLAAAVLAATEKTSIVNDDLFGIDDSAASNVLKKIKYTTVKQAVAQFVLMNGPLMNGKPVITLAANALTLAIKTNAGDDPTAADPVYIAVRSATPGDGGFSIIALTAAISVTLSSGSTGGTISATPHRIYFGICNDAGTARLWLYNPYNPTGPTLIGVQSGSIYSSTAEGGAGGADSAQVFYSTSAFTSKGVTVLGYFESTQATAGTWATAISGLHILKIGDKITGDVVQTVVTSTGAAASGTTVIPRDDTIPTAAEGIEFITRAITPTSAVNLLRINSALHLLCSVATTKICFLHRSAGAALAVTAECGANSNDVDSYNPLVIEYQELAGGTSSITYAIRASGDAAGTYRINSDAGGREFGGVFNSFLKVEEIFV